MGIASFPGPAFS